MAKRWSHTVPETAIPHFGTFYEQNWGDVRGTGTGDLSRAHVLAEYVREGQWKFALYADGRQETWRL